MKELQQSDSPGKVQIIEDRRIDSLLVKYLNNNLKKQKIPGFRIRIFSVNSQDGRQRATEAKSKFINKYSGISADVYWESPDFKVDVGEFRTRTEAYRFKKQIESMFPNSRIVESQIDYNKL